MKAINEKSHVKEEIAYMRSEINKRLDDLVILLENRRENIGYLEKLQPSQVCKKWDGLALNLNSLSLIKSTN